MHEILKIWEEKEEAFCLNRLRDARLERLPGKRRLIKAVDIQRTTDKRKTEYEGEADYSPVSRPFDENSFHFLKVKPGEEICRFGDTAILINISPLAYGHILICPFIDQKLSQEIHSVKVLEEGFSLLHDIFPEFDDFRVCFNSLGGWASVNHLHFHGVFLKGKEGILAVADDGRFPIEVASAETLIHDGQVEVSLVDSHVISIRFVSLHQGYLLRSVYRFLSYLISRDIAHNIVASQDGVWVIPRKKQRVSLLPYSEAGGLHVAVAECGGYLLCFDGSTYEYLTEDDVVKICRSQVSLEEHDLKELVARAFIDTKI